MESTREHSLRGNLRRDALQQSNLIDIVARPSTLLDHAEVMFPSLSPPRSTFVSMIRCSDTSVISWVSSDTRSTPSETRTAILRFLHRQLRTIIAKLSRGCSSALCPCAFSHWVCGLRTTPPRPCRIAVSVFASCIVSIAIEFVRFQNLPTWLSLVITCRREIHITKQQYPVLRQSASSVFSKPENEGVRSLPGCTIGYTCLGRRLV